MKYVVIHANGRVNVFNLGCDTYTDVTSIANMLVKAMGQANAMLSFTGGDRGWKGDVPQVRFDVGKINRLGWHARYTSDEAVVNAINDMLGK